jgi:hypothetical protein
MKVKKIKIAPIWGFESVSKNNDDASRNKDFNPIRIRNPSERQRKATKSISFSAPDVQIKMVGLKKSNKKNSLD